MKLSDGYVEAEGLVKSIERSIIPTVVIIQIDCGDVKVKMDLVRKLLVFDEGDKVRIIVSRSKPDYQEGKDFVAWGYVMSKKKERRVTNGTRKDIYKLLISLWGYLVILESENNELLNVFNNMDKVYVKISKV